MNNLPSRLVYKRAGHILITKYLPNGTLDTTATGNYSSSVGIVKSIARANNDETVDLPDGNSDYPAHTYVTGKESTLTVEFSTFDPLLEAFLNSCEVTPKSESPNEFKVFEDIAASSNGVVLKNKVKDADAFIFISDNFGNVFTASSSGSVTTGQYSIAVTEGAATLTFSADDEGKELHIVYDAYLTGVTTIDYPEKPTIPAYKVVILGEAMNYDESTPVKSCVTITKASMNGGMSPPTQSNDPTGGFSLSFKTSAPVAGQPPVRIQYLPLI